MSLISVHASAYGCSLPPIGTSSEVVLALRLFGPRPNLNHRQTRIRT